jgi:hypothetical protein
MRMTVLRAVPAHKRFRVAQHEISLVDLSGTHSLVPKSKQILVGWWNFQLQIDSFFRDSGGFDLPGVENRQHTAVFHLVLTPADCKPDPSDLSAVRASCFLFGGYPISNLSPSHPIGSVVRRQRS